MIVFQFFDQEINQSEKPKPSLRGKIPWAVTLFSYLALHSLIILFVFRTGCMPIASISAGVACGGTVALLFNYFLFFIILFLVLAIVKLFRHRPGRHERNQSIFNLSLVFNILLGLLLVALYGLLRLSFYYHAHPEEMPVYKRGKAQIEFVSFTETPVYDNKTNKIIGLQLKLGVKPKISGDYLIHPASVVQWRDMPVLSGDNQNSPPAAAQTRFLSAGQIHQFHYFIDTGDYFHDYQESARNGFFHVFWEVDFDPPYPQKLWQKASRVNIFSTRNYRLDQFVP